MNLLETEHLTVRRGGVTIVEDVSFSVAPGSWLMLIGPNGAGKTTLINAVSRAIPYSGAVRCMGRDARRMKSAEFARSVGVLSQTHAVGSAFTVGEVVRLGLYADTRGVFSSRREDGEERVRRALEATGMTELEEHSMLTLSGGEVQRTFIAQLLAQDPKLLILDEPANHLDLVYQKQIFALLAEWLKGEGRAIISVVHDLSLARAYGTHALLLNGGQTVAYGAAAEVFVPERLNEAYSMDVAGWMRGLLGQWNDCVP